MSVYVAWRNLFERLDQVLRIARIAFEDVCGIHLTITRRIVSRLLRVLRAVPRSDQSHPDSLKSRPIRWAPSIGGRLGHQPGSPGFAAHSRSCGLNQSSRASALETVAVDHLEFLQPTPDLCADQVDGVRSTSSVGRSGQCQRVDLPVVATAVAYVEVQGAAGGCHLLGSELSFDDVGFPWKYRRRESRARRPGRSRR